MPINIFSFNARHYIEGEVFGSIPHVLPFHHLKLIKSTDCCQRPCNWIGTSQCTKCM